MEAYRAYNVPSVKAFVRYFHATAGYPVKDTWPKATKAGNYVSWLDLTLSNTTKYCPSSDNTIKGHMVQTCGNIRSTRQCLSPSKVTGVFNEFQGSGYPSKTASPSNDSEPLPPDDGVHCLHVYTVHCSKLYTDNTGRFPIRARSRN